MDRVLYGSDYPYLRRNLAIGGREQLARTCALSDAERVSVLGETALTLLPRIASSLRAAA
jgi:6-methylsalicylate decarboxylase